MQRELKPELLESLPPDHPDAMHNRRDLRIINRVLGNHRWFAGTLPPCCGRRKSPRAPAPAPVELGDYLAARGLRHRRTRSLAGPGRPAGGAALAPGDLLTFAGYDDYPVILGNLIFHQFTAVQLAELGRRLRGSASCLACEPVRWRRSQLVFATGACCLAPIMSACTMPGSALPPAFSAPSCPKCSA